MHSLDDTIVAIASAPGGAARGIVRLSGPSVEKCLEACFRTGSQNVHLSFEYPHVFEGELRLTGIHAPLPCEVYLWPAGRSYTGQMVAEFHTFGSPPLLESLLKTLTSAGARLAEPGEFTLRAFLSGRIDLTQAEAVLGVIEAAGNRQLQTALGQLAGGLAGPLHELRHELLELLAHLEAGFDFVEEDISFISIEELDAQLAAATKKIAALLEKMSSRSVVEIAVKAVLIGRPNTGKSSLFNMLLRKANALVSSAPGTTRDYLTAELDFDGMKCQLIDTAGIGEDLLAAKQSEVKDKGWEAIDSAAQTSAKEQHQQATIRLLCLDATRELEEWEWDQIEKCDDESTVIVLTKCDSTVGQVFNLSFGEGETRQVKNLSYISTSSKTGEGIELLRDELRQKILAQGKSGGDVVAGTAARCRESLQAAEECLRRARQFLEEKTGEEYVAGEIRLALEELGRVVGAVYTDDVLDRIFSRFCVGK